MPIDSPGDMRIPAMRAAGAFSSLATNAEKSGSAATSAIREATIATASMSSSS